MVRRPTAILPPASRIRRYRGHGAAAHRAHRYRQIRRSLSSVRSNRPRAGHAFHDPALVDPAGWAEVGAALRLGRRAPEGLGADADPLLARRGLGIPEEFQGLGFAESYHGHQGRGGVRAIRRGIRVLGDPPREGDGLRRPGADPRRVSRQGAGQRRGDAAGVLRAGHAPEGLVVRDQFFYSWEQGLRAAGLEPEDRTWRPAGRRRG